MFQTENNKTHEEYPEQSHPTVPSTAQWNVPSGVPGYAGNITPMAQQLPFHQIFQKGKPKALGIVLIIVGILHIASGIGAFYVSSFLMVVSGIPFWGAVFYIIAGSLTVAANARASKCLIQGSLGLNIVVSIFSVPGLILSILDLWYNYCFYHGVFYYCYGLGSRIVGGYAIRAFFIVTYLLLFCVSVSISVFASRAVRSSESTVPPQVFVIQATAAAPSTIPGGYPTLQQQPPPYSTQGGPMA